MILDRGICSIFRKVDTAEAGAMPRPGYILIYQSWYGEPSFETNSARPTDGRKELRTDARIRIMQNREIRQNDVCVLRDVCRFSQVKKSELVFRINRAFHGQDDDGPTLISDLSLEAMEP